MEKESVYQKAERAAEEALKRIPQQCKDGILKTEVFVDNSRLELRVEVDIYFKDKSFKTVVFWAKQLFTEMTWVVGELADAALNYKVRNEWGIPQNSWEGLVV